MDSCVLLARGSSPGITGEEEDKRSAGRSSIGTIARSPVSFSPPAFSSDDEGEGSSSSFCSSSSTLLSDDDDDDEVEQGRGDEAKSPLSKMSDLIAELPIKRGLSRHYNGKSQSYTSLASVKSIDDLPKPERGPARKKLKWCRSYGGGMADPVDAATARHNAVKLCLRPPPLPPASAVKPVPALVGKVGPGPATASLQLSPPLVMASERSGGFLRGNRRPPSPLPPQRRPGVFPAASHPQALLFA